MTGCYGAITAFAAMITWQFLEHGSHDALTKATTAFSDLEIEGLWVLNPIIVLAMIYLQLRQTK